MNKFHIIIVVIVIIIATITLQHVLSSRPIVTVILHGREAIFEHRVNGKDGRGEQSTNKHLASSVFATILRCDEFPSKQPRTNCRTLYLGVAWNRDAFVACILVVEGRRERRLCRILSPSQGATDNKI